MAEIISILTEFDAIMDTDLTVMKILQRKYNNPKYIKQDVMCLPLSDLKKKICEREHECTSASLSPTSWRSLMKSSSEILTSEISL